MLYAKKEKSISCNKDIDFSLVQTKFAKMAADIRLKKDAIIKVLLAYESFEVAEDEIDRTLDLLDSIYENSSFFRKKICVVYTFLPRNQPLYALFCFAVIPSVLSDSVLIKRHSHMGYFFDSLLELLAININFNNIFLYEGDRSSFLKIIQSHSCYNPVCPGAAVVFTGSGKNAEAISKSIPKDILFIANGSCHNPVVIAKDADIINHIEKIIRSKVYNSGQDCGSPNSFLVHQDQYDTFCELLKGELSRVKYGDYSSEDVRVGYLIGKDSTYKVSNILSCNKEWLDEKYNGEFFQTNHGLGLKPTIIFRPLKCGGNYVESYAPIFVIQKYETDCELKDYFENRYYFEHAAYVCLFGYSDYVLSKLPLLKYKNTCINPLESIIINKDLHEKGVERGTQPYGGCGAFASFVKYNGKKYSFPTLPQRDIYKFLIVSGTSNL